MKNAKLHKIFLTALVSLLILVLAVAFIPKKSASVFADGGEKASDYFTGINDANLSFENDNMVAKISADSISNKDEEKGVLAFKKDLIINDMLLKVKVPEGMKSLTVIFENESYYEVGNPMVKKSFENGNVKFEKDADGKYIYTSEKVVVTELKYDFASKKAVFNGDANKSFDFTLVDGVLSVNADVIENYVVVDGVRADDLKDPSDATKTLEYRKIKAIDDKSITKIKFMFDVDEKSVSEQNPVNFEIISVDQEASETSNNNYEQTFELNADGNFVKEAYPVVAVSEQFYKKNADRSYSIVKDLMVRYTVEIKGFSVLGSVSDSSLYLKSNNKDVWLETATEKPTSVQFEKEGNYTLTIAGPDGVEYDTIDVSVTNFDNNSVAPEYVARDTNEDVYFAYEVAIFNAYYNVEKGEHLALGQSFEVPSLKDLVFDDLDSYEQLTTMVYYANDSTALTMAGSFAISLNQAGDYYFFVVVADRNRNEMDKDKDFVKNEDNQNPKYADCVFSFHMIDDALIKVSSAASQGKGYVGVNYTASAFTVDANSCKTTYKLFYCADVNATENSDWIEIPAASTVKDQSKLYGDFTYEDVQSIGYDGSLSFKPIKVGAYKIECTATSTITSRAESSYSIIQVESEPDQVKVYKEWFKDNVWTVVFLGVGTICLIGIVALLFTKPKDKTEE